MAFFHSNQGFIMSKKRIWGTMLSLIVTLSVLIAFGGTVLADNEAGSYSFSQTSFSITSGGFTDFEISFQSLQLGSFLNNDNEVVQTEYATFVFHNGRLSDNHGHEVQFVAADGYHYYENKRVSVGSFDSPDDKLKFSILIDEQDFASLPSGTYTGYLDYDCFWQGEYGDYVVENDCLNLTLTVPEKVGDNLTWNINSSGVLTVSGTGNMNNFDGPLPAWFNDRKSVNEIVIKDGVTSIGRNAFREFTNVRAVTIPQSVTSIGANAFANCSSLTSIYCKANPADLTWNVQNDFQTKRPTCYVPHRFYSDYCSKFSGLNVQFEPYYIKDPSTGIGSGLTWSIDGDGTLVISGSGAMSDLSSYNHPMENYKDVITSIVIENGVTYIGENAFYSLSNVKSVSIADSVTNIGPSAFQYCSSLKSVTIPDSVTVIGFRAFGDCAGLKTVTVSNNLTELGGGAFYNGGLTTITLPGSLTTIGSGIFTSCDDLTSVVLSSGITKITAYEFEDCPKLKSVTVPDTVTSIGQEAFKNSGITSITIPAGVTVISADAFNDCGSLATVTLSAGLEEIGDNAFYGCRKLTSITIPYTVKTIGENAFYQCYALATVEFSSTAANPTALKSTGKGAFMYCTALTAVDIPSGITEISPLTFRGCTKLASVTLPDGLQSIKVDGFNSCGLTSIVIPDTVTEIGRFAFYSCKELKTVSLPSGLTMISVDAFRWCEKLESIEIPDGVTKIELGAFDNCRSLKSVVIPNSVTSIEQGAFFNCINLESVTLSTNLKAIENTTFAKCSSLKSIRIPHGVTRIYHEAFKECTSLASVSLPGTLERIDDEAFLNCSSLTSIAIPYNVSLIETDAFKGCTGITDVYCYPTDPDYFEWLDGNCDDFKANKATKCHVDRNLSDYETKYSDVNVTFVLDQINMGGNVHVYGYSLSLEGDIGVNFYVHLSGDITTSNTSKIVFTVTGLDGSKTRTQTVYVNPQSDSALAYSKLDQTGDFNIFKCNVAAKEMTSTITAQVYNDGVAVGDPFTYSVQEYARYILSNPLKFPKEQDLVKAMLNYGTAAQKYFKYNEGNYANSILPAYEQNTAVLNASDITGYDLKDVTDGIGFEQVSLTLGSTISMKLYVRTDTLPNGAEFRGFGGLVYRTYKSGEYTVVVVENITAKQLMSGVTVNICQGQNEVGHIKYSPASYCKVILNQPTDTTYTNELKEAICALYMYARAAQNY